MAIKYVPRRTQRYEALRKKGFTKQEARTLSHVPEDTPYLQQMMNARLIDYNKFKRQNARRMNPQQLEKAWENKVISNYKAKGWWKGKNERSVWEMLRENKHGEDAYKRTDKQYKSPWVQKQKVFRETTKAVEKGLNKVAS